MIWGVETSYDTVCPWNRWAQASMMKTSVLHYNHHPARTSPPHSSFILYYSTAKYSTMLDNKRNVVTHSCQCFIIVLQVKRRHYISKWLKAIPQYSSGINTSILKRDSNLWPAVSPFSPSSGKGTALKHQSMCLPEPSRVRLRSGDLKLKAITLTNTDLSLCLQG